jgi:hypothetical protein
MDGLSLLFRICIYIFEGLLLLGLILLIIGLVKKDKEIIKTSIKSLTVPVVLTISYLLYQLFCAFFLMKPSSKELVGVYAVIDSKNIAQNTKNCNLIIENDLTYVFTSLPLQKTEEVGRFKLSYDKKYHELIFYSDKNFRTAYIDRHFNGFTLKVNLIGDNNQQTISFTKID